MLNGRSDGLAPRDEHEDEKEGDEVGRRVDVQDVRRSDERNEQPRRAPGRAARRVRVPPSIELFACDIRRSSSPTSSGRIVRCDAKYGGMKQPSSATSPSSRPKLRTPAECRSGIDARIGARAKSATSIVVREPSR